MDINIIQEISRHITNNSVVFLEGEMGSGKTFTAKALIKILSPHIDINSVSSPTYNIFNQYDNIVHCDLYRISDINIIYNSGLLDYIGNHIILIEWPNIIKKIINPNIFIHINKNNITYNLLKS